jgi:hypothetical protein
MPLSPVLAESSAPGDGVKYGNGTALEVLRM